MASTRYDGHKSNQSDASAHSSSSPRSARIANLAVESAVARLLVDIKQFLDSLTMWSNLQLTETQISDVYRWLRLRSSI
ncbi:hypothetical protein OG21DRAFT_1483074 [Imleria badia]|nr:hypothetical protein OG21DRAFT_1483074 [Imleria badia]